MATNQYEKLGEIRSGAVYTTAETEKLLKISKSTVKRLLKRGLIRANKIGGQYRILGKELLHILSPELEREAVKSYRNLKRNMSQKIKNW